MSALSSARTTRAPKVFAKRSSRSSGVACASGPSAAAASSSCSQRRASCTNACAPPPLGTERRWSRTRSGGRCAAAERDPDAKFRAASELARRRRSCRRASARAPGRARARCPCPRACGPRRRRRDRSARTSAAARASACRRRCPRRAARARSPSRVKLSETRPSSVNLSAFESRLRTIFSHMSRSTNSGSSSGSQSTVKLRPARLHRGAKVAREVARERGEVRRLVRRAARGPPRCARSRAASSRASGGAPRCGAQARARRAASAACRSRRAAASSGPSISVSGVRNSWLTFEKNVVFARSSSASASARLRSAS